MKISRIILAFIAISTNKIKNIRNFRGQLRVAVPGSNFYSWTLLAAGVKNNFKVLLAWWVTKIVTMFAPQIWPSNAKPLRSIFGDLNMMGKLIPFRIPWYGFSSFEWRFYPRGLYRSKLPSCSILVLTNFIMKVNRLIEDIDELFSSHGQIVYYVSDGSRRVEIRLPL